MPFDDFQKQPEISPLTAEALRYLTEERKLTRDALTAYRLGSNKAGEIVIPFYDDHGEIALTRFRGVNGRFVTRERWNEQTRTYDPYQVKSWVAPNGRPVLLGSHLCDAAEGALVICFGEYDALAVAQDGVPNAVSVPFGDNSHDFIKEQWEFLKSFSEIILFPDRGRTKDEAEAIDKNVFALAKRLGLYRCKRVRDVDYHDAKDPNDLLVKKGAGFNRRAIENAVLIPQPGLIRLADAPERNRAEGVKTGWAEIDRLTGGLAGGQLTIIGGDNESGKTQSVLNILAAFTREQVPSFFWSGEQKSDVLRKLFERIVAGETFCVKQTSQYSGRDYYFADPQHLPAIRAWYGDFVYFLDTADVDEEFLFKSMEVAVQRHECKLFVIDNLMAFTDGLSEQEYALQASFAKNCKTFAEEWDVHVIIVAHNHKEPNDQIPDKDSLNGTRKVPNRADFVIQIYRVPEKLRENPKEGNRLYGVDTVFNLCKNRETGLKTKARMLYSQSSGRLIDCENFAAAREPYGWESAELLAGVGRYDSDEDLPSEFQM